MRKTLRVLLILGFSLAFILIMAFTARMRREILQASMPISERNFDFTALEEVDGGRNAAGRGGPAAKISAEAEETFLQAFDLNLDEDEDMEQVIVSRPRTAGESAARLSVIVAEYQGLTGSYYRLWKGETQAVKPKAFVFQPRDILGSADPELLCFGIDESGNQTLSVFSRNPGGKRAFDTIFEGSGLRLELVGPESEGESEGSAGEVSIALYTPAQDGGSPLDRILTLYSYSPNRRKFQAGQPLYILGENVEKDYIDSIATGSAQDFLGFLDGLWVKEGGGSAAGSTAAGGTAAETVLISFSRDAREIAIKETKDLQVWTWEEASPSLAGLRLAIENSAAPELARLLTIDLVGIDKIEIGSYQRQTARFSPREGWRGRYTRYSEPYEATDTPRGYSRTGQYLEGHYSSERAALDLSGGTFRLEEGRSVSIGFYETSVLGGKLILDLVLEGEATDPSRRRSFAAEIKDSGSGDPPALILKEVRLKALSFEYLYTPDLVLRAE